MSDIQNVKVGSTVTELEEGLFKDMKLLREVDFSSSPTSLAIPKQCFKGCETLQRCIYPGAKEIQEDDELIYLDYIIGNGAWIDTGIIPTLDMTLAFEIQQRYADNFTSGSNYWIGTYHKNNNFNFLLISREATNADIIWDYGDREVFWGNIGKFQWIRGQGSNGLFTSNIINIGGSKATSLNTEGKTITIFGNSGRIEDFKIRYLKIYKDGVKNLIMDLVPVIDATNEVCFLDKVSKKLLKSQNSVKMIGVM